MTQWQIHSVTLTLTNGIPLKASEIGSIFQLVIEGSKSKTWERKGSSRTEKSRRWWKADLYGHIAGQGGEVCGGPWKRRHMRSMGGSCHRPKLSMRCQSPANIGDWRSGGHGCISKELIPYPFWFSVTCWWTSYPMLHILGGRPCGPWIARSIASRARWGHTWEREGVLTNLIPSPVGNAGCRDGFRASWHNCHRVVVEVVVPVFSAEIFPVLSRCCWRFTSSIWS